MFAQNHLIYDILIVGGGIVGLTFANLLAKSGLSIAIIEQGPQKISETNLSYDLRVSAITPASLKIFKKINAWDQITPKSDFSKIKVWDETGDGLIQFKANDLGESALGYIIENKAITQSLLAILNEFSNINFFYELKPTHLVYDLDHIVLCCSDGKKLKAKLCVGADGVESFVRREAQIPLETKFYNHKAIVTMVKTEKKHKKTARQRFLKDGILAFLPLEDPYYCSIVWSNLPTKADSLMSLDPHTFNQTLTQALDEDLGQVECEADKLIFPLKMQHVKNYVKARIALLGDAAHTIHPLAGQGLNLGIADAASLAEIILNANMNNLDLGALSLLQKYQRNRKGPNLLMSSLMDTFKSLFASELKPIIMARNLGLSLTDKVIPLKSWIMQQAMGL